MLRILTDWLRRWRTWFNPIPVVIFMWLLIFGDQGLVMLHQLQETKTSLTTKAAKQKQHLEELQVESERLHDPKYLEPVIRRKLGYIRPGETVYQFTE
jgi:cell division protein FtsB